MAETIGAAASVLTLVITAYQTCKTLHDTLSAIRNAPKHILYISSDLEDFYSVLGTIQAILDDDDSAKGILQSATSENLQQVLENSLVVFADISALIKPYSLIKPYYYLGSRIDSSTWSRGRLKWTFKEKDVEDLRRTLLAHKMTLNMAISVANLYNLGTSNATADRIEADIQELQEKLPSILQQLEEVKENQLSKAKAHSDLDRVAVGVDYGFTLRHFLDAASVVTSLATPIAPSLQVSAFGASNSAITSTFRTAPESRKALSLIPERCTQLSIINMPAIETLVVQVHPEDTIGEVKGKIRQKIRLPDALFSLAHGGRVFSKNDSLESCDIAHDSTFICNSFRPNTFDGDASLRDGVHSVTVKDLSDDSTFHFNLNQGISLSDITGYVRAYLRDELRVDVDNTWLVHAGRAWQEGQVTEDSLISRHGDMLWHMAHLLHQGVEFASNEIASDPRLLPKLEPSLPSSLPPSRRSKWQAPFDFNGLAPRRRYVRLIPWAAMDDGVTWFPN